MTSVTTPQDTRRQDPRRRVRTTGDLLVVTSMLQLGFGLALLMAPAWVHHHLSGAARTSRELAIVLRVAGGGLLLIGAWCALGRLSEGGLPRSRPLDLVPGLVVYYGCAVAVLADAIMRGVRAPLLWPAFALHLALLFWCLVCLGLERGARQ